jgi:DNA-directed RNA polymerase-3 subunit RPC5
LDILSRRNKRAWDGTSDSDSDDGPPPDPDEPARVPAAKKGKKPMPESREVQVSARKPEDKGGAQIPGGLSAVRKEILNAIRAEEDVSWEDLQYYDVSVCMLQPFSMRSFISYQQTIESEQALERILSQNDHVLECSTNMTAFLREIHGL